MQLTLVQRQGMVLQGASKKQLMPWLEKAGYTMSLENGVKTDSKKYSQK